MVEQDLIADVLERMAQLRITQSELAASCSLSQPHLSKVLGRHVNLAKKTRQRLADWLAVAGSTADSAPNDMVRALAARLEAARPAKRMQIMELLRAIERLIDGDEHQPSARSSTPPDDPE